MIRAHRGLFDVEVLTAGKNAELLIEQALQFVPPVVVIADESQYNEVKEALVMLPVKVMAGMPAISEAAAMPGVDIVLTAMVGFAGLQPTIAAISAGKNIALANKETLVVGGSIIMQLAREKGCGIYPVDSEHSAIFQCLQGEKHDSVEKLILTASGGPFRGMNMEQLCHVTCQEALKHPKWCMGSKVTIDSASMMNKGLEVIEASWLFDLHADKIDVVIHPQSVIHSMVQFVDGSVKAQMGLPDMRLPIQYALGFPGRLESSFPRLNFSECRELTFEEPDQSIFRNLSLAYEALRKGGNMPCIMNAANEVVVQSFLKEQIRFVDMPAIIEDAMGRVKFVTDPAYEDLAHTDVVTREYVKRQIKTSRQRQ